MPSGIVHVCIIMQANHSLMCNNYLICINLHGIVAIPYQFLTCDIWLWDLNLLLWKCYAIIQHVHSWFTRCVYTLAIRLQVYISDKSLMSMLYWLYAFQFTIDLHLTGRFNLFAPDQYHYLNQSGCVGDPTINDAQDFINVKVLMYEMSAINILFMYPITELFKTCSSYWKYSLCGNCKSVKC